MVIAVSFDLHLDTEQIQHIETSVPIYASPEQSVQEVLVQMRAERKGSVLVTENDQLLGIFTERDALAVMAGSVPLETPIRELMKSDVVTISSQDTVQTAVQRMSSGGYRRLAVLNPEGKPVSIIKATNIMRYLVDHFPQAIFNLPPKPHHTTHEREGA